MDLQKHLEFFDPINDIKAPVHVLGCGAIGSVLLEMFTRLGIQEIHIYDFDIVEPANVANQMFMQRHIGQPKETAVIEIMKMINPEIKVIAHGKYINQPLRGYIFLCVDNIDLRRQITTAQKYNPYVLAVFDFRMRLTDAQHYGADWSNEKMKDALLDTMAFSHAEAQAATPINACGSTLSIAPTVRTIVSLGVTNFINFLKGKPIKKMILVDTFHYMLDVF